MTQEELRQIATYVQYRLDSAGVGPMKFSQPFVQSLIEVIELAATALQAAAQDRRPPPRYRPLS